MKYPQHPAFSPFTDIGVSKIEYTYIEVLKSLIVPGKTYTEEEVNILLKNASFIARKAFEKPPKQEEKSSTIKKGDIVEMTGNLSKDLLSMKKPRLGEVINVNGAYILVKPEGKTYEADFLENEVKLYKKL